MNRIVLVWILLGGLFFSGCDSFLDKDPDSRAEIDNLSAIQELLVNAYPQASYHLICETMSDNVTDLGYGRNSVTAVTDKEMYFWEDGSEIGYDSPNAVWTGFYAGIAVANHALEELEKYPDSDLKRALTGEALLCRALGHFFLVNLFAEHYDPATENTALGVPYVTKPEKHAVEQYKRNTMKETYDMIEEDLRRGLSMVNGEIYGQPKYHFTERAAHAFAARFYTYKGTDWEQVLYHANKAIAEDFRFEMRSYEANSKMVTQYREFMLNYTLASNPAILLSVTTPSYWNDMYATCPPTASQYTLSTQLVRQIVPIISRMSFNQSIWYYFNMSPGSSPAASMVKSYGYFKATSATSSSGMTYLNIPMFTVEDVALMRMEAEMMLGMSNYALRDLNYFLSMRDVNYYRGTTEAGALVFTNLVDFYTGGEGRKRQDLKPHYAAELESDYRKNAFLKAVVDLRRMEFLQEGLRWFDIKRFHLEVEHYNSETDKMMVLGRNDARRALEIPQDAQLVGVEPNK